MGIVFAYVTVASWDEGRQIGRALVEERLAACINLVPGMTSIYRWEGKVEETNEVVLIAKTRAELFEPLADRVRSLHSYKVPCILELPVGRGNPSYLDWLTEGTKPH